MYQYELQCPVCNSPARHIYPRRDVQIRSWCYGDLGHHHETVSREVVDIRDLDKPAFDIAAWWSSPRVQQYRYPGPPAIHHHHTGVAPMDEHYFFSRDPGLERFARGAVSYLSTPPPTPEQLFQGLDVEVGDRVRLTTLNAPDAAQLEGKLLGIKRRKAGSQVRIAGFDHTGGEGPDSKGRYNPTGGQHVWFPVRNYKVEVLHRAFRWTPDDELVADLVFNGLNSRGRKLWESYSEETREMYRKRYADRIAKIKKVLGVETSKSS